MIGVVSTMSPMELKRMISILGPVNDTYSLFANRYSLLNKRIINHLISYTRFRSVPGVNHGIFGQGEEFRFNAVHQFIEIARRQIGAPDSIPEQHISGDDEAIRRTVKTHTTVGMARSIQNPQ
jgi:hypothetical protein